MLTHPDLRFDKTTEDAYGAWLDHDSRYLLRIAFGFAGPVFLLNHLADHGVPDADVDSLLLVRLLAAGAFLAIFCCISIFRHFSTVAIASAGVIIAGSANAAIAHYLPTDGGFWLIASQVIVGLMVVMVVGRFRDLVLVTALLFVLPTVFHTLDTNHAGQAIVEICFFGTAAAAMVFLGHFVDQSRRTVFKLSHELGHAATHDTLTGIYNRARIMQSLDHEIRRFERLKHPFSVLCIDIDHFKKINDTYGHVAGDEVLKATARHINDAMRGSDCFGRTGGEEFLAVLPDTLTADAEILAERIRDSVARSAVDWQDHAINCTISIGVASFTRADSATTLLARGDDALYRAKANGRNRVETAAPPCDDGSFRLGDLMPEAGLSRGGTTAAAR